MTVHGPTAELVWGYHQAALLGAWTVTLASSGGGGTLTASVLSLDEFRASQRPVVFHVSRPGSPWRWPVNALQIVDRTLTAELGPPEE